MMDGLLQAFWAPLTETYFQKALIGGCAVAIVSGVVGCRKLPPCSGGLSAGVPIAALPAGICGAPWSSDRKSAHLRTCAGFGFLSVR